MNNKLVDITEKQILRDQTLEILQAAGSSGANRKVISLALHKSGYGAGDRDLDDALSYLEGKGLIRSERVQNRALGIDMVVYRITPDGVDVLEGTAEAPGIGVGYGG